jgi:nitrogen fixation protein NifU and related proteins
MPSERLIEQFRNPRNVGELPHPAFRVNVENPACGDMLRLSAQVEGGKVEKATFKVRGCVASIATASALTELMTGKTRDELLRLSPSDLEAAVGGLENESKHAAQLCVDGVRQLCSVWPTA